ncbi:MAG: glycosyltransferase [Firmicutes bacterium]|nr:glycosyltransferase [Bacillota bacterium]
MALTSPYSILAMMAVRNEADRYLRPVLERLAALVDGIVILDDASTDQTPELCRAHPKVIRFRRLDSSLFSQNEAALRSLLWEMTVELEPTWILALDADELLEEKAKTVLPALTAQQEFELITFPVYHFWGDLRHYRVDRLWHPALARTACLFRYQKNRIYHWAPRRLHCGRFPAEAYLTPRLHAPLRLLHLGYAAPRERREKYHRYLSLDPDGCFCPLEHYRSIIEPHPRLRRWMGENLEVLF